VIIIVASTISRNSTGNVNRSSSSSSGSSSTFL